MLEICRHIEYLLTEHDCVLIPEWGGFVLQDVPARRSDDGKTWFPPTRAIVFNPSLTYNDGMLAASLMRARKTDAHRALLLIRREVGTLRSLLQKEGDRVAFGNLGSFALDENLRPTFTANADYRIDLRQFGMQRLTILPLRELSAPTPSKTKAVDAAGKDDTIRISIHRRTAYKIAAAAAIFLLLFLTASPIREINRTENHAALAPTEIVQDDMNNRIAEPEYLIVVSTLSTRENALLQLQRFHNKGVTEKMFLYEDGRRVYLYTRSFTDRQAAYSYVRQQRQEGTPFTDAWVMKAQTKRGK